MATCNIEDLTSQACLSGFFGQTPVTSLAIELQLIKNLSGDTSTLDALMLQACASGFVGQDPKASKAIELQLWCNFTTNTPSVILLAPTIAESPPLTGQMVATNNPLNPSPDAGNNGYRFYFNTDPDCLSFPPLGSYTLFDGSNGGGFRISPNQVNDTLGYCWKVSVVVNGVESPLSNFAKSNA